MADLSAKDSVGPMRQIHDDYRSALLNKKYYGARLQTLRRMNRVLEIIIAVGAAGSGIAGFALWKTGDGIVAWGIISGLSVILATIKPLLDWPKDIERYGKLSAGWSSIHGALSVIEGEIRAAGCLSSEHVEAARTHRKRIPELAELDDPDPNHDVIKRFEDEVKKEVPVGSLWMPVIGPDPAVPSATAITPAKPATPVRRRAAPTTNQGGN